MYNYAWKANQYESGLLAEIINFKKNTNPRSQEKKQGKQIVLNNLHKYFEDREKILDSFESKIISIKFKGAGILNLDHSRIKVLTPK